MVYLSGIIIIKGVFLCQNHIIVELVKQDHTVKSLAEEYNVSANTINRWIKQNKIIKVDGKNISYEKYVQMEKKLAEAQEELEILKRAAVLLGRR
ncbi:helix-turn-helix domain-containing protein [Liquorilactobacillus satsumensis]|uniref:helix-turn-helix domain-containing protein n=1 Tax=Liquorilactobacillus satsumensis TaxID=259059 RepID=UPI0009EACC88|nr:helix-turn-helix domain-containing protein [Liquorilactobacillus satsumensis]